MLRDTPIEVVESWPHSPTEDDRLFAVWPLYAGRSQAKTEYSAGPRVRPYFSIHVVLAGRITFRNERMQLPATIDAGGLFCIFPGLISRQHAVPGHPAQLAWLAFDGPAAPAIVTRLGLHAEQPIRHGLDIPRMRRLVRQMGKAFTGGGQALRPTEYLVEFLGELLSSAPDKRGQRSWLDTARAMLDEHCTENIGIAEVAAQVGVDRTHLSKTFSAEFGMSPTTYLQRARLTQARRLLAETQLSISQIARAVGYADVYAFSHAFRRRTGTSPSEARGHDTPA